MKNNINFSNIDNVYYKRSKLFKDKYEVMNANLIDNIIQNDDKLNMMILPEGSYNRAITLVDFAISLYIKETINNDNDILKKLQPGDIVVYKGNRVKFLGIEKMYGEQLIILQHDKNDILYIRKDKAYELTIYDGNANSLSVMSSIEKKRKDITKETISETLGISKYEFIGNITNQTIIVIPSIAVIDKLIENVEINLPGIYLKFSSIFPCSYWSSGENYRDYPGNVAGQKQLIKFTSKLSTARDMIFNDKEIKNIIIYGEEVYKNGINELESISKRKSLEKIIIINDWSSLNLYKDVVETFEELKIYAWDKLAIKNEVYESIRSGVHTENLEKINIKRLKNKVNENIRSEKVYINKELQELFIQTRDQIIKFKKENINLGIEVVDFVNTAIYLLNLFENMCIPICEYESEIEIRRLNEKRPKFIINDLIDKRRIFKNYNKIYEEYNCICNNLELIYHENYEKNLKYDWLLKYLRSKFRLNNAIVVRRNTEVFALERVLKKYNLQAKIFNINSVNPDLIFDEIILNGVAYNGRFDIFNTTNSSNKMNLIYNHQEPIFNKLIKRNEKLCKSIENKNLLIKDSIENLQEPYSEEVNDEILEVTEILREYNVVDKLETIDIDDLINYTISNNKNSYSSIQNIKVEKIVIFETGEYALLSRFYKASILDISSGSILEKEVNDIREGDEVVFVRSSEISGDNVVDTIMQRLLDIDKFKLTYKEKYDLSNLWKEELKKYIDKYNMTYKVLSKKLSQYYKVSDANISNWMNSNIIGPRDIGALEAIAKVIEDSEFLYKVGDIFEACREIRSLHRKITFSLGKIIVNSIANETQETTDELGKLILESIGDVNAYISVVQVEKIIPENREVPAGLVNKLLNEGV